MKPHDCGCGGIPQVTYTIDQQKEFSVSCPICGSSTPVSNNLKAAVTTWNSYYWAIEYCNLVFDEAAE
jgi:hypothetical protein